MKYKRKTNIVERVIHDSFYLIDICDNYLDDKCRLYEMNEMGSVIWNMIDYSYKEESQLDYIVIRIKELLVDDVPYDVIKGDVNAFLSDIYEIGFLEAV